LGIKEADCPSILTVRTITFVTVLNIVRIINNIFFNTIDEVAPKELLYMSLSLLSLLIFERQIEGVFQ